MEIKPIVTPDFVVLDEDVTLAEMLAQLQNQEKRIGLVFRKNKYVGMVEKRDIIKSRLDVHQAKLKNFLYKTPVLKEETDLLDAAKMFYQTEMDFLPVEKNKKIFGVVNSLDLAKSALVLPEAKNLHVQEVKYAKPSKVSPDDKLAKALGIMHEENVDLVPVFDSGVVSGVLSYRDILRKYLNWSPQKDFSARHNALMKTKRSQVEFSPLVSLPISDFSTNDNLRMVNSMDALSVAVNIMHNNRIHNLVVVDNNDYKGMLTVRNILNKFSSFKTQKDYSLQFIGLKDSKLSSTDKYSLQKLAESEALRLQRKIKQKMDITMHLKEHGKKDRGREKFSIIMHLTLPGKQLVSEHVDWDPFTVMKNAFYLAEQEAMKVIGRQLARDKKILKFCIKYNFSLFLFVSSPKFYSQDDFL